MPGPTLGVQFAAAAAGTFSLGTDALSAAIPATTMSVALARRESLIPYL